MRHSVVFLYCIRLCPAGALQSQLTLRSVFVPVHVVDYARLKEQVSSWHQVVHDVVLVGPHSDSVANTQ